VAWWLARQVKVDTVNVLFFGWKGAGKSEILNNMHTLCSDEKRVRLKEVASPSDDHVTKGLRGRLLEGFTTKPALRIFDTSQSPTGCACNLAVLINRLSLAHTSRA
jgi:hypothetical protein